jgi:hypothetical protein
VIWLADFDHAAVATDRVTQPKDGSDQPRKTPRNAEGEKTDAKKKDDIAHRALALSSSALTAVLVTMTIANTAQDPRRWEASRQRRR